LCSVLHGDGDSRQRVSLVISRDVAEEIAFHAHTRAQKRAADEAKALDEPIIPTTSSDDKTVDQIAPPPRAFATTTNKIAPPLSRAKIAPQPPRAFVSMTNEIALSDKLANHNALAIARAFLRHSVEFVLPPHYRPDVCVCCFVFITPIMGNNYGPGVIP